MMADQTSRDAGEGAELEARIFPERVGLIYRNTLFAQAMLLTLVLLTAVALGTRMGALTIGAWAAGMVAVSLPRLWFALEYRRDPDAFARAGHWYRIALAGTVAAGLGWAALVVIAFPALDPAYRNLVVLIVAGVTAGAVPVLSADLRLYLVYEFLILAPLLAQLLGQGETVYTLFAVATLLYGLTLARSASYLNKLVSENLRERFAKEVALEQSDEANRKLTAEIERRRRLEHDLVAARDAAEAASRAKSEFLANASHEIRTPMNGIIGMTSLALDTELTEEQRDYLETMLDLANDMLKMLTEVLQYSRLGNGQVSLRVASVDPLELVDSALRDARPAADAKRLWLRREFGADIPAMIRVDPEPIRRVFDQLLDNASKFTESGGVLVRLEREPGTANKLHFSVRDSGIGIPEDKLDIIFDSFTQADGSSTRAHGGLGLGLALCAGLAGLLDGDLRVDSKVGEGSTFHFVFPYET